MPINTKYEILNPTIALVFAYYRETVWHTLNFTGTEEIIEMSIPKVEVFNFYFYKKQWRFREWILLYLWIPKTVVKSLIVKLQLSIFSNNRDNEKGEWPVEVENLPGRGIFITDYKYYLQFHYLYKKNNNSQHLKY